MAGRLKGNVRKLASIRSTHCHAAVTAASVCPRVWHCAQCNVSTSLVWFATEAFSVAATWWPASHGRKKAVCGLFRGQDHVLGQYSPLPYST